MYPTISDLIFDLIGIHIPLPIQSFGFFVALSFLFGAWAMAAELKRKEQQGILKSIIKTTTKGEPASASDLIFSAIGGFIVGYKLLYIIQNYALFSDNPQSTILSAKGNLMGGIALAALLVYLKFAEKKKEQLDIPITENMEIHPDQLMGNITIISAISGLIGAKIFHNLENLDEFLRDPVGSLISFSGLTFYGGLICGTLAVLWYGKKHGIHWIHLVDAAAPGLMLAYGIGRIGCQIAGDGDWGIANNLPQPTWLSFLPHWAWAYNYPHNVVNEGIPMQNCLGKHCYALEQNVFPTPLYESIIGISMFLVLWFIRKKINTAGMMFSIYLLMNGVERFFIEKIRINTLYHIFGYAMTQAEIISFSLMIGGIAGIVYFSKRKMREKS